MNKFLKTLVVFVFLLGAAALGLGIMAFMQREVIKENTLRLEKSAKQMAANLKYEKQYTDQLVGSLKVKSWDAVELQAQCNKLDTQLRKLATHAGNRQQELEDTQSTLATTEATLEDTETKLAQKIVDLNQALADIEELKVNIAQTRDELETVRNEVTQLTQQKVDLENNVNELNANIAEKEETILSLEAAQETLKSDLARLKQEFDRCKGHDDDRNPEEWVGRTAEVLAVNTDWDYVVINRGKTDQLPPNLTAYVHRGDTFIAKLKISQIKDSLAIATVDRSSLVGQTEVRPGDTIFF